MDNTTVRDPRVLVLGYHRIAAPLADPWSLSVTPAHFADHLQRVCARGRPQPFEDVVRLGSSGRLSGPTVVVTFDDGYADTLGAALPLLQSYGVPATVFLTSGYIGSDREFWWDALERILLMPGRLPSSLRVTIGEHVREWQFAESLEYSAESCGHHCDWGAFDAPPTERHAAYREMWALIGPLREDARRAVLDELFVAANLENTARETHRLLREPEVLQLGRSDLVQFGSHSVTHSMLSSLNEAEQRQEIVVSKASLEALTGRPVTMFAYPYGQKEHYTQETVGMVREAGFLCACSNFPGVLTPRTSLYEIPRLQVYDCDGEQFERLLDNWLA
jgi:peptidoglycan/xylan/chitin deacetylase (PgdA/CDA1 family)